MVVSTSFWSWLLNVSSILTSLQYTGSLFWFVNALWVCWRFMGVVSFDFGFRVSEICLFLCSSLMRFFVVQFFSFFWTVWLGKKSWCVHCCSIHWFSNLAIVTEADLRCGDFLSEKSCRHKLVVSTGFWSWLLNVSSVLTS